jgi:hypothetical protein
MKIVRFLCLGSLAVVVFGCAGQRAEEQLFSLAAVEEGWNLTVTELERGPNYSVVAFKEIESATVTGSAMFLQKATIDIAKERGFQYFHWGFAARPNPAQADKAVTHIVKIFFTNDYTIPLEELMGDDYSENAQKDFDRRGHYMPVSLFGGSPQASGKETDAANPGLPPNFLREVQLTRERAYYAAMKSDLRNLAFREEAYFSDHGTYTDDPASLRFVTSGGVTATITASDDGWAATVTHSALGEEDGCAIYFGSATAPTSPAQPTGPGEVACNRDG